MARIIDITGQRFGRCGIDGEHISLHQAAHHLAIPLYTFRRHILRALRRESATHGT